MAKLEKVKTEVWTPDMQLDEPVLRAVEIFNSQDPKSQREELRQKIEVSPDGIVYAVLDENQPQEYSSTEAIVEYLPFANTATDNMLERAEFIRLVAKLSGITDSDGKFLPVIMLASPGIGGSRLSLDNEQLLKIRSGDLGVLAKELLRAVEIRDFGRIALVGFSQGADVALAAEQHADAANLDVRGIAIGDPAGIAKRGIVPLGRDFLSTGTKDLKKSVEASGLEHKMESIDMADFARFLSSIILSRTNHKVWQGLGYNSFSGDLTRALTGRQAIKGNLSTIAVGFGSESAIAKPEVLVPLLEEAKQYDVHNILTSIKVEGANHTWGDQLTLLATLYMRAFK